MPQTRRLIQTGRSIRFDHTHTKTFPVDSMSTQPQKREEIAYNQIRPNAPGMEKIFGGLANLLLSPFHLLGSGFLTIEPNCVGVATYYSNYTGQKFSEGLNWTPTPIGLKIKTVYMGARTIDMKNSKVIDSNGNPILVSGVMNYNIKNPEQFLFGFENGGDYIYNQAEKILKKIVSNYSYDELKKEDNEITELMINEAQKALDVTGIKINDFSLTDMNYAKEIASSMLAVQQASATAAAREQIVKAACDIVQDAVNKFEDNLDEKSRAELIKNLLVVITSNNHVQPVVNVTN